MLGRLTPAQVVRQAEELLQQRQLPPPPDPMKMGWRWGGPGMDEASHAAYLGVSVGALREWEAWRKGGSLPTLVEALDLVYIDVELEETV